MRKLVTMIILFVWMMITKTKRKLLIFLIPTGNPCNPLQMKLYHCGKYTTIIGQWSPTKGPSISLPNYFEHYIYISVSFISTFLKNSTTGRLIE